MRVALVTTGKMELLGLPSALKLLFPEHTFLSEESRPGEPFPGFTSKRVVLPQEDGGVGHAGKLVEAALGTIVEGADRAIILEDLELINQGNEQAVVDHLRAEIGRFLQKPALPATAAERLRAQVSFHLAVPMVESWLFGDPQGPIHAGVPTSRLPPRLVPGRDPECFLTEDPAYCVDDGDGCEAWQRAGRPPHNEPKWLKTRRRVEHPKAYLSWLARHPSQGDCSGYHEAKQGKRALQKLNWNSVLQNPDWFKYLRSMVRDLELSLGSATVSTGGQLARLTDPTLSRPAPLLRNL